MTDAVPPGARCTQDGCEREAVDPNHPAGFCPEHHPTVEADDQDDHADDPTRTTETDNTAETEENHTEEPDSSRSNPTPDADESRSTDSDNERLEQRANEWGNVDFQTTTPDTYPPALLEREQWMGQLAGEKRPFAPWADADHPDADEDTDARYKWGLSENYVDGDTVALAEDDPRLDGRVFLQQESDPFAFVDGDDVRCPETGAVHPEFVDILQALGATYVDVSTSGTGVHAYYEGDLPNDQGQAVFEIDTEPWGANDDPPTVEIYANTHVCVTTGDHVAGTPETVAQWDAGTVEQILEDFDALKDTDPVEHDTDRDLDLDDHQPEATAREDSTTDTRDIALAVDRLTPRDLPLRTRQVGTDGTGWEKWDPSTYRTSSGNDSLHRPTGEPVFHDHKHNESFGVLSLFAAEQGIISKPWNRLAGADWWDAVDAAREKGAPIPEYTGTRGDETEHTAVLPPAVRDLSTATSGWDWKHAGSTADSLTVDDARERTVDAIADAYKRYAHVLVEALPTMGKSYGAVKAAAETDEPITIFTGRGRKEQYQQFVEWCEEHGLGCKQLPSFTHDCPTAAGDHGEEWRETVMDWYRRGATPQQIHNAAEYHLDQPLPCQTAEDGTQIDCEYRHAWNFDPDEYDVLIGHYTHAYTQQPVEGRTVVFDEFPDAYESGLTTMQGAISYWLSTVDAVPFDSYTDLVENRDDQQRRGEALLWFEDNGVEPDESHVFDDAKAHADAPLAVYTLLAADDLGNGFETADLGDTGTAVFNRDTTEVSVLRPPDLDYASGVVALDGTPTKRMWDLMLGLTGEQRLTHRPVLQDGERTEYLREALNLNLVRSSEYVKSYNSEDHVAVEKDAALLEAIAEDHGQRPSLITTMTAKGEYDDAGVLDLVDETKHYGNVLGSNEFDDTRLGAVIGSNHYGDDYIQKWGAYAGEAVERAGGKGQDLSYTGFGDQIHQHMTEHDTLQAAMRFGRDGNGAVVYVHTDTLPDWVPLAGEARVVSTWSEGKKAVVDALADLGEATTAEIAAHPAVDVGRRQVLDHLTDLCERGVLQRDQDDQDGRRTRWRETDLDRLGDYGETTLDDSDEFETPDLEDLEVAELPRMSTTYTWEFVNFDADTGDGPGQLGESTTDAVDEATSGGDPPPDRGD